MKYDIRLLAAVGRSGQIGLDNGLPWHNKSDLKWFKELTMGHVLVAGYNTYQSLPNLPGRVVLLDDKDKSPIDFLDLYYKWGDLSNVVWVIGGAKTYARWLPFVSKAYIGLIDYEGPADTFMPSLWKN